MLEEKGEGWLEFTAIMLMIAGLLHIVWGVVALSKEVLLTKQFLFGNQTFWGVVWLILGIVEALSGFAILDRRQWARWLAIILVSLSMIGMFTVIKAHAAGSLIIIAIQVLVLYGLAAYGGRMEAARSD